MAEVSTKVLFDFNYIVLLRFAMAQREQINIKTRWFNVSPSSGLGVVKSFLKALRHI